MQCADCGAMVSIPSARQKLSLVKQASPADLECPSCGSPYKQGAVLCINCGLDFRTGKKHKLASDSPGRFSFKRILAFVCLLLCAVGALIVAGMVRNDPALRSAIVDKFHAAMNAVSFSQPAAISPMAAPEVVEPWKLLSDEMAERARECVRFQSQIKVPHNLPEELSVNVGRFRGASVVRVEPDGLSLIHGTGVEKIGYEEMPAEWLEQYHIDVAVADAYRENIRHGEAVERREQAGRMEDIERQREQERSEHDASLEEICSERNLKAKAAWEKYDNEMAAYRNDSRQYQNELRINASRGRLTTRIKPRPPIPPSCPRPCPDGNEAAVTAHAQ